MWTIRKSVTFARSEARYSVYPSTVASFRTTYECSMIDAFPYPVSCERSITFPMWNFAARLTLYCEPSAASTVRITVPSNAGATHKLSMVWKAEDAFTLYVHESPTCQVGVPIGPAAGCGRVPLGGPRFVRFSGPTATAKATSNKDVAKTLTMSAFRCVSIILDPATYEHSSYIRIMIQT